MCEDIEAAERAWAAIDKMPENLRIQTAELQHGLAVAHLRRDEDALRFMEQHDLPYDSSPKNMYLDLLRCDKGAECLTGRIMNMNQRSRVTFSRLRFLDAPWDDSLAPLEVYPRDTDDVEGAMLAALAAHAFLNESYKRFSEAFPVSSFDECVLYATVKYFSLFGDSQARASASKHRILRTFDIHQKMLLR